MAKVLNFLAFQGVWAACVLTAARGHIWLGLLSALAFALVTLSVSHYRRADLSLMALAVVLGGSLDTLWSWIGWMDYAASPWGHLAPPWILGLWFAFAMTLNHSLAWLRFRPAALAALAAMACPLSYYAGHRLGAVEWHFVPGLLVVTPLSWAAVLVCLSVFNRRALMRGGEHVATLA
ncbi:MAG: DUF2878 domain-containing protein [Pseudomonadota bacterium]